MLLLLLAVLLLLLLLPVLLVLLMLLRTPALKLCGRGGGIARPFPGIPPLLVVCALLSCVGNRYTLAAVAADARISGRAKLGKAAASPPTAGAPCRPVDDSLAASAGALGMNVPRPKLVPLRTGTRTEVV